MNRIITGLATGRGHIAARSKGAWPPVAVLIVASAWRARSEENYLPAAAGEDYLAMEIQEDSPPATVPDLTFDVGSQDRYVWRGLVLTDGPVLQPAVTVESSGFSVNVWGNFDLDQVNSNQGEFNELDVTLGYSKQLSILDLSTGVINYNFPNTASESTTELYAGVQFDVPFQPAIKAYFDVDEARGTYLTMDVGHSFGSDYGNPTEWEFALGLGFGWGSPEHNKLYFGAETDGVTDIHVALAFSIEIYEKWTVAQSITYSVVADDGLRSVVEKDQNVVFSLGLSVEY